jgi:DNA polymerase
MSRGEQLELLEERVRTCELCALSRTRNNAVPGEGPLDAEVMFIGEAPGVNEDKQGRPFVGAAGQFLGELLAAAGLRREDAYICNVLKCRPPGNRDPLPAEIEACDPYLEEQIALIDPLVIVTLGRFSMARFVSGASISRIHGQHRTLPGGRYYVPMYHPAAALHQASLKDTLIEDFTRLRGLLTRARDERADEALSQPEEPVEAAPAEATRQMKLFE